MSKKTMTKEQDHTQAPSLEEQREQQANEYQTQPLAGPSVETIIGADNAVHTIVMILMKGKQASNSKFLLHTNLIVRLRGAYQRGDSNEFLTIIETYFIEAYRCIPHIPAADKRIELCVNLLNLIRMYSLYEVGRKILSGMY